MKKKRKKKNKLNKLPLAIAIVFLCFITLRSVLYVAFEDRATLSLNLQLLFLIYLAFSLGFFSYYPFEHKKKTIVRALRKSEVDKILNEIKNDSPQTIMPESIKPEQVLQSTQDLQRKDDKTIIE